MKRIVSVLAATWAFVGCASPPAATSTPAPCATAPSIAATGAPSSVTAPPLDAGGIADAAATASTDAGPPAKQLPHEDFTIASKVLDEARKIHLYTPPASAGEARDAGAAAPLPILYLLDGGDDEDFPHPAMMATIDKAIRAGDMRPIVIVGIENTERRRDTTGPTTVDKDKTIAPHVGGSAAFRTFLKTELRAEIDRRFPKHGPNAIAGESLAGLFVVETLLLEPALFETYLAVSPSLWWNAGALAKNAPATLKKHANVHATLYLTRAGDDIVEPIDAFAAALRTSARPGSGSALRWTYEQRSDLHHADIYESIAPAVVRRLWPAQPK